MSASSLGATTAGRSASDASTPSTREVSASTSFRVADFFGGTRVGGSAALTYRPGPILRVEVAGRYDWVSFGDEARPNQDLAAINGRLAIGFLPTLGLDIFGRWGATDALLQLQNRLRWTLAEGSDLFLVYQWNFETEARKTAFHSLIAKLTWRFGS